MNRYKISTLVLVILTWLTSACIGELEREPLDKRITTADRIFSNPASYKEFLAKLYGSITLTGQNGPYGSPEISNPDEGETSFMRSYWSLQELTTDEAICAWNNGEVLSLHNHQWTTQNLQIKLLYQRIFININYCNEYLREVSPRVSGLSTEMQENVRGYITEARFIRALYYYFALDLFGNVPFVTETDDIGAFLPRQISRADLFEYIESELLAIIPELPAPGTNEYARADKAAAWMLLAKLYLNAEVYLGTGNPHYTEALTYCNNIINSGVYSLHNNYKELFMADNHLLRNEIIFPIAEDGTHTQSYGGMTFIMHAAIGGPTQDATEYGIKAGDGWAGNRFTNTFVNTFDDVSGETDSRIMTFTDGQVLDINTVTLFTEGYLSTKFKNKTSANVAGANDVFPDTDFPLFRYADVYLMYAEAVVREGTGGNLGTAVDYVNELRERAYGDTSGDITSGELTLDFILDERGRELYWEAQRRTDLIRFEKFTGDDYVWDWKGGVKAGRNTPTHLNLFPIPAFDRAINTNLDQNPGY
jgi:hypothetical protein